MTKTETFYLLLLIESSRMTVLYQPLGPKCQEDSNFDSVLIDHAKIWWSSILFSIILRWYYDINRKESRTLCDKQHEKLRNSLILKALKLLFIEFLLL